MFDRNQKSIDNTDIISAQKLKRLVYFLVEPNETFKTLSDVGFRTRAVSGRRLCGHVVGSLLISRTHKRPGSARLPQPAYQSRGFR